jgi:photosystem II stability/assembly factor-like uncharacterized protein
VTGAESPPPPEIPGPTLEPLAELVAIPAGSDLQLDRIHMLSATNGWGIGGVPGSSLRVLRTADGGLSWSDVSPPIPMSRQAVREDLVAAFVDPDSAWIVRYLPNPSGGMPAPEPEVLIVWRTEDGGESWQPSPPLELDFLGGIGGPPYLEIQPEVGGWLLPRAGGAGMHQYPVSLLRASAEDWQWLLIHDPFSDEGSGLMSCHKSGMAFNGEGIGVLTIDSFPVTGPEIRRTRDGGDTWEIVTMPLPPDPMIEQEGGFCEGHSVSFLEDGTLAVAVECRVFLDELRTSNHLYFSADRGDSWDPADFPGGTPTFLRDGTIWASSRQVWRSLDNGQTWELRKTVFWDGQFSFISEGLGWAVAVEGEEVALVRTEDGGASWQLLEPILAP